MVVASNPPKEPRRRRSPLDPDHRTTRVVLNALDLLETFADGQVEQGVSAIAARLGLAKNNVFRILATLEARGYVEQDRRTERYRLAPGSLRLGLSMLEQVGLARQARAVLDTLAAETGETARLAVLRGHAAVCVAQSDLPDRSVQVVLPVGTPLPLHATAVGQVLLAYDASELDGLVAPGGLLPPRTPHTVRDPGALRARVARVQSLGFALDDGEYAADVRCVAAPVRDYARRVIGAISVSGPAARIGSARVESELLPRLRESAVALSRRLGHEPVGL
jgi:DNA-binding IclR family transcriptional regulator